MSQIQFTTITAIKDERYHRIRSAAATVVKVLDGRGIACAVFGSLACKLYGNTRRPNDVDILVLPRSGQNLTTEDVKSMIVNDDRRFFLKRSRKPGATYRILWYRYFSGRQFNVESEFKVDILLPGILHLPPLSLERINWVQCSQPISDDEATDSLPLLPLSVVLLQKLQAWDDHKFATQRDHVIKQHTDVQDLQNMLKLQCVLELASVAPWEDAALFNEEFQRLSRRRVKDFCRCFPSSEEAWRILGFPTSDEPTLILE